MGSTVYTPHCGKGPHVNIQTELIIIVVLLLLIWWEINKISSRLKDRFPTEEEQDYQWSLKDPAGHWEAHKRHEENDQED
jgi:hypothetical protein